MIINNDGNQTQQQTIFTVPAFGQGVWYSVRLHLELQSGLSADASIKINGNHYPDANGPINVSVTASQTKGSTSVEVFVNPGDVFSFNASADSDATTWIANVTLERVLDEL